MHRLIVTAIACFCLVPGFAQHQTDKLARYSLDFTLSQTNFVDSIAIEWTGGQVYLPVEINGKRYRFLFDTGAGQTLIFSDTPIDGCQSAGQIVSVDAIGRRDTVTMTTLPPLTLGNITFTGCQATVQQRAVHRNNLDGIIGFDIINKGLNAKIDVRAGLLILSDRRDFFDTEAGYEARYRLHYHVPYIILNPFAKYKAPTLFDTGSRQFYVINDNQLDEALDGRTRLPGLQVDGRVRGRYAIGHSGTEPEGDVTFLTLNAMKWGDFLFSDVSAMTTQGGSHLGAAVLSYGSVTFNPRRRRAKFQPFDDATFCSVANKPFDIAFIAVDGLPAVGLVREGCDAFQQGLRYGDIILSIDNRPVRSFSQFIAWPFEKGRSYRFTVRTRNGETRQVEWVRLP